MRRAVLTLLTKDLDPIAGFKTPRCARNDKQCCTRNDKTIKMILFQWPLYKDLW